MRLLFYCCYVIIASSNITCSGANLLYGRAQINTIRKTNISSFYNLIKTLIDA